MSSTGNKFSAAIGKNFKWINQLRKFKKAFPYDPLIQTKLPVILSHLEDCNTSLIVDSKRVEIRETEQVLIDLKNNLEERLIALEELREGKS